MYDLTHKPQANERISLSKISEERSLRNQTAKIGPVPCVNGLGTWDESLFPKVHRLAWRISSQGTNKIWLRYFLIQMTS
jgi:hypothetical protein